MTQKVFLSTQARGRSGARLAAGWCLAAFAWLSAANERVALVIGNAAYEYVPPLVNPRNDAEDMAGLLRRLGFVVTEGLDLTDSAMKDRIRAFARRARGAEVALVFYAGHGMQVGGVNYLLPVDARLADELDLDFEAVALDLVLRSMGTGTNLVFLDACRDNPFSRGWAGAARSLVGRGLKRVEGGSASGMFIAFATDPDSIAADGDGRNSPFTAALKRHIETPGLEINSLLTEVRNSVLTSTGNVQRPWSNSSLSAPFYFVPAGASAARITSQAGRTTLDPAEETWLQIRDTASVRTLERYLATYPNSRYRIAAEARLEELARQPFTVAVRPSSARVRILNGAGGEYKDGMLLPAGNYRIEASAKGHETKVEVVSHGKSPTLHRLVLMPTDGVFRDCEDCPDMVVISPGVFRMGDLSGDGDENARPVREVRIARFAVSKYEVTVAQFRRFVLATGYRTDAERNYGKNNLEGCEILDKTRVKWEFTAGRSWRNLEYDIEDEQPVVCVSWNDTKAYLDWLQSQLHLPYRLPSEAEWEYAARAGSETTYHFGNDEKRLCMYGNVSDETPFFNGRVWLNRAACSDRALFPALVGSYRANAFGLHDVVGNVEEWTADCWNESYRKAPQDGKAWKAGKCSLRVWRDGSWGSGNITDLAAASRGWSGRAYRSMRRGFRVARTLAP